MLRCLLLTKNRLIGVFLIRRYLCCLKVLSLFAWDSALWYSYCTRTIWAMFWEVGRFFKELWTNTNRYPNVVVKLLSNFSCILINCNPKVVKDNGYSGCWTVNEQLHIALEHSPTFPMLCSHRWAVSKLEKYVWKRQFPKLLCYQLVFYLGVWWEFRATSRCRFFSFKFPLEGNSFA